MICCKIIADYNNPQGDFSKLFKTLSNYGDVLWENNALFFGDTENIKTSESKVKSIIKKSGYSKSFIDVYDQTNEPHEGEYVNGWIYDKIIKINYKMCELTSQKVFRETMVGLDELDKEIERLREEAKQEIDKEEECNG